MKTTLFMTICITFFCGCGNSTNEKASSGEPSAIVVEPSTDTLSKDVLAYLDTIPQASYDLEETVLPNGKKYGIYLAELKQRSGADENLIFKSDLRQDQLSQLLVSFLKHSSDLVDDSKHQFAAGSTPSTEPAQKNGIAYNYSSSEFDKREKMFATSCALKVYGLDCSGFLYQVFKKSGCKGMDVSSSEQATVKELNDAIKGVVTGIVAKDKGRIGTNKILAGDIVFWDTVNGKKNNHIGLVLKKANNSIVVFASNGSSSECDGNLVPGRGPRTFELNDSYWFAANCRWRVLRYE